MDIPGDKRKETGNIVKRETGGQTLLVTFKEPNHKFQISNKFQFQNFKIQSKRNMHFILEFRICSLGFVCNLALMIWNLFFFMQKHGDRHLY
jgi:hypothetical protein